jgi:hypothetical protein
LVAWRRKLDRCIFKHWPGRLRRLPRHAGVCDVSMVFAVIAAGMPNALDDKDTAAFCTSLISMSTPLQYLIIKLLGRLPPVMQIPRPLQPSL